MKDGAPFKELPRWQRIGVIISATTFSAYLLLATYGPEIADASLKTAR
jgi:hypothetical protein